MKESEVTEFEASDSGENYQFDTGDKSICYGMRIEKEKLVITINNKNIHEFSKQDAPKNINLNDSGDLGSLLNILRKEGLKKLISAFQPSLN